jgi:hypothetical protein
LAHREVLDEERRDDVHERRTLPLEAVVSRRTLSEHDSKFLLAESTGRPVLVTTELSLADPHDAGPATLRRRGAMCCASGPRAVRALAHAYRFSRHRGGAR